MMNYTLENYEEQLRHQVVHMDQAVCYCPEFRATKMMNQYPSRRLQIARAIWLGHMDVTDYSGEINFAGILSRQGERWQNFGESPEDCTDATILARAMLLEKGYVSPATKAFEEAVAKNEVYPEITWELPVDGSSKTAVLLDAATANCGTDCEKTVKDFMDAKNMAFVNEAKSKMVGFEYFAYGLVEEGKAYLAALIESYNQMKVEKVVVFSAQAAYMLTTFAAKLGIEVNFEVVYLVDLLDTMEQAEKTYVYAGSFNLRYLGKSESFNTLAPSSDTTQIPTSQEFIPVLKGDKRINQLTIWQKPIAAEYKLYEANKDMMDAIAEDAFRDIAEANPNKILVFEPTAYTALKEKFADKEVVYYLNELK